MRKLFALALVALLALTMALVVVGCSQKKEEPAATEVAPPAETMPADTMGGAVSDTTQK
jgi:hypothetical protein